MRTNASGEVVEINLEEQLRLLESLPAELRNLIHHAPVCVDVRVIWLIWERYAMDAERQIEQVFDADFPGWRDPPVSARTRAYRVQRKLQGISNGHVVVDIK